MSESKVITYDAAEIARAINIVKDAVDKSTFGPLISIKDPHDITSKQLNQLAWQVFGGVLPVMMQSYFNTVTKSVRRD